MPASTATTAYSPLRYRGHIKLWTMVIIRAIFDYVYGKDSPQKSSRLLSQKAEAWLFKSEGVDSLDEVCLKANNIPPEYVRGYAKRVEKKDLKRLRLTERDFQDAVLDANAG